MACRCPVGTQEYSRQAGPPASSREKYIVACPGTGPPTAVREASGGGAAQPTRTKARAKGADVFGMADLPYYRRPASLGCLAAGPDRLPDPLAGGRHLDVPDPERRQRVQYR